MQSAATRRRKAYWVATKVGMSYLWLSFLRRIRGQGYWDKHIKNYNLKNATRIKNAMLELQGLFIKFGQLISILSNALPKEFRAPLEELQDNVPADSFAEMQKAMRDELGRDPAEIFSFIDPKPLAAASIGQVHRAKIGTQEVIIKIQHPNIDELIRIDLVIIKRVVRLFARFFKINGANHLYTQVEQMMAEELDYEQEAQSMKIIKENLLSEPRFYIPKVYDEYTSRKMIVQEFCAGAKISDLAQMDSWGIDKEEIAKIIIKGFCHMIMTDGFYHADPHPGNLLINEYGQIILLDFGAVAKLSNEMRSGIPKLIRATLQQDAEEMVIILRQLGFIANNGDAARIAEKLIDNLQDFVHNELKLENLNFQEITTDQLQQAFALINIKEITQIAQIPKEWVLLNRAVVLVSGISFLLAPEMNPVNIVKPYLQKELLGQAGGAAQNLAGDVVGQIQAALTLPRQVQKTLKRLNKGKIEIEIRSLEKELKGIHKVGKQFVWLAFFVASIYFYLHISELGNHPFLLVFFQAIGIFSFLGFAWNITKR